MIISCSPISALCSKTNINIILNIRYPWFDYELHFDRAVPFYIMARKDQALALIAREESVRLREEAVLGRENVVLRREKTVLEREQAVLEMEKTVLLREEAVKLKEQALLKLPNQEAVCVITEDKSKNDDTTVEYGASGTKYRVKLEEEDLLSEDITVSALAAKDKRGRPQEDAAKAEKKAKVAKIQKKPGKCKAVAKDKPAVEATRAENSAVDVRGFNLIHRSRYERTNGAMQGNVVSLQCYTIFIGTYKYTPHQKVTISPQGVEIIAPSLKEESRDVALKIKLEELSEAIVLSDPPVPNIVLLTSSQSACYVREALDMVDDTVGLRHACQRERNYRDSMAWKARNFGDSRQYAEAQKLRTPSCEKLQTFHR